MFIKIYFDSIPVILSEKNDEIIRNSLFDSGNLIVESPSNSEIENLLSEIQNTTYNSIIIFHDNFELMKNDFFSRFTIIQAGGGVIENQKKELLMIFRRGKWDLPKGKIDEGETIEECALREVREETGLIHLKLLNKLMITYHTYVEKNDRILKESHWFKMEYYGNSEPIPQIEEQITKVEWANPLLLDKYYLNTFPVIKEILQRNLLFWHGIG